MDQYDGHMYDHGGKYDDTQDEDELSTAAQSVFYFLKLKSTFLYKKQFFIILYMQMLEKLSLFRYGIVYLFKLTLQNYCYQYISKLSNVIGWCRGDSISCIC